MMWCDVRIPCSALSEEGGSRRLGRWIGVTHRIGSDACYWVLPETGILMACTMVQEITELDLKTDAIKEKVKAFENKL